MEASFKGGADAWRKYLERNLKASTPVDNGASPGSYTVVVQFIVDKEGKISNVKASTNHGYGMEEEAVKIIKKGPTWEPAIQKGRQVKAYRKQPIDFIVGVSANESTQRDDPNEKSYEGTPKNFGVRVKTISNETYDFNENAKVAMDVVVDAKGKVISVTYQPRGSTTSSLQYIDIARGLAFQLELGSSDGGGKGMVVFNFKVKE